MIYLVASIYVVLICALAVWVTCRIDRLLRRERKPLELIVHATGVLTDKKLGDRVFRELVRRQKRGDRPLL